jgi:hypothetical protein
VEDKQQTRVTTGARVGLEVHSSIMEEKFVDIKEEEKQTMQYPKDKKQTMIYKAKLKIEQQKLQYNQE